MSALLAQSVLRLVGLLAGVLYYRRIRALHETLPPDRELRRRVMWRETLLVTVMLAGWAALYAWVVEPSASSVSDALVVALTCGALGYWLTLRFMMGFLDGPPVNKYPRERVAMTLGARIGVALLFLFLLSPFIVALVMSGISGS